MTLRPASPDDHDALFALHVELFRRHIEQIWGWDDEWQIKNFKEEWTEVRTEILSHEGEKLGYVQIRQEADHLYVLSLGLYPRFQRLGFGSASMGILKERARLAGKSVKLSVFRTNQRAIEFYKRLGFEIEAETETGIRMHWRNITSNANQNTEPVAPEPSPGCPSESYGPRTTKN